MGLGEKDLLKYLPNATQCDNWHAIRESHNTKGQNVVFKIEDIYGIVLLLAIGLSGAFLVATVEYIFLKKKADSDGTSSVEQLKSKSITTPIDVIIQEL